MGEEEERGREMMKPWEQHSAVISIPRFDYKAPSSLLHHSHSAFLLTCPIKREKSATKEAIAIFEKEKEQRFLSSDGVEIQLNCENHFKLELLKNVGNGEFESYIIKFGPMLGFKDFNTVRSRSAAFSPFSGGMTGPTIGSNMFASHDEIALRDKKLILVCIQLTKAEIIMSYYAGKSECFGNSDAIVAVKRRKVCHGELDVDCSVSKSDNAGNSVETERKLPEESCSPTSKSDTDSSTRYNLSLVKLTRSGLLLFTPENDFPDVIDVVSNIFRCLELQQLSSPLWCHRIFPIQATCCLNEKELQTILSKLVVQFVKDHQDKLQRPIKFAIGYNRRGIEETELKTSRKSSGDTEELALLDRNKCFGVVAAAIKDIIPDSVVDLKSPELSVLVEVLPLSGIPNGSVVVGVAVLPHNLVSTKPRLCIKALLSDTKTKNGKQK